MKLGLGAKSIILLVFSIALLLLFTVCESWFSGSSLAAERIDSALLLIVSAVVGVIFGVPSLVRKESTPWLGGPRIVLNALFALFQFFVFSFAG